MVKVSVLLGAIPLATALYIPHSDSANSVELFDDHETGSRTAQGYAADELAKGKPHGKSKAKKHGCGKSKGKKHMVSKHHDGHHGKPHGKHHSKHHGPPPPPPSDEQPPRGPPGPTPPPPPPPPASDLSTAVMPEKVESYDLDSHIVTPTSMDKIIPDSYIVVLKKDLSEDSLATSLQFLAEQSGETLQSYIQANTDHALLKVESGFDLKKVYNFGSDFRGYAGRFLPEVAEMLAQQPEVAYVERDSIVHTLNPKEEDEAPWGLARVSHRKHLHLGTYNKYLYDNEAGKGVTAYIVDTGIYIDHEDFEGRASWGKTVPIGDVDVDAHGHGSHCAGTIGGKKYGVAKQANLVAVKVLGSDGSGSMSDVIGGVEYVVESHRKEQKEKGSKFKGSTANMSLGGGKSPSLDIAVNAATQAGVHFAVAAGNDNQDACYYSPASAEGAVTVGATDVRDDRAYFSNYGKCVDIFAPGVNVLSIGTSSPSSTAIMSGTSMASPHIAGLLTYFVSLQPSSDSEYATRGLITTKELKKHLISFGTPDSIADLDSESPNVLAYNGGGKDISDFWIAPSEKDDEEDKEKHSFLDKVEDTYESIVDYFEDLVESSQEIAGSLF